EQGRCSGPGGQNGFPWPGGPPADPAPQLERSATRCIMTPQVVQRLAETVAWCSRHARADDAGASTRTPELRPPIMAHRGNDLLRRLLVSPAEPRAAVEHLCAARRRALERLAIAVPPVGADVAGGRILYTTIDTDSCECATGPSNGYLDLDDLPGWDTWFYHRDTGSHGGSIYCWVPPPLVELADRGLQTLPCES